MNDELIRVSQAALRLRISPQWLYREVVEGKIPSLNCGGVILVNIKVVRDILLQRASTERNAGRRSES